MPRVTKLKPPKKHAPERLAESSLLVEYRAMADRIGEDLRTKSLTATEVAKLSVTRRSILEKIGLLTGEGQVTEAQILKSPAWERVRVAMIEALRPYPDAARAVVDAIRALEEGPKRA